MGRFDDSIAWCRKQLGLAEEDQERYQRDRVWEGETEVTQDRKGRAERNIGLFRRLIAAYEKHND
jgi:hypothetical protein